MSEFSLFKMRIHQNYIHKARKRFLYFSGAVLVVVAITMQPLWQIIQTRQVNANRKREAACTKIKFSLDEEPDVYDTHL